MVRVSILWQTTGIPTHEEQLWLQLNLHEPVVRAARQLIASGKPTTYELVSVPISRFPKTDSSSDLVDISVLAKLNGIVLGQATEKHATVPADRIIAQHLQIAAGDRVLRAERVVLTDKGLPIEWRILYAPLQS
jgi:DNA-binding GntR family transcriptional regulator